MGKQSAARHYNVDGEEVSLEEILGRTKLARGTIRGRLEKGLRTWASLGEDPAKAQLRNRNNLRRQMHAENLTRQADKKNRSATDQRVQAKMPRNRDGSSRLP